MSRTAYTDSTDSDAVVGELYQCPECFTAVRQVDGVVVEVNSDGTPVDVEHEHGFEANVDY